MASRFMTAQDLVRLDQVLLGDIGRVLTHVESELGR